MTRIVWLILAALALALLIWQLAGLNPGALTIEANQMRLVYALALLTFLGSALILGWQGRVRDGLKAAAIWMLIAVGLMAAYVFADDVARALGLAPPFDMPDGPARDA